MIAASVVELCEHAPLDCGSKRQRDALGGCGPPRALDEFACGLGGNTDLRTRALELFV